MKAIIDIKDYGTIKVELYSDDPGEYSITELEDRVNVVLKQVFSIKSIVAS